VAWKVLVDDAS